MTLHLPATTYTWVSTAGGTNYWTNAANWSPPGFPNAVDDVANLNVNALGTLYVIIDTTNTIGSIILGDTTTPFYGTYLWTNAGGVLRVTNTTGEGAFINAAASFLSPVQVVVDAILESDLLVSNLSPNGSLWVSGNIMETGVRRVRIHSTTNGNVNLYGDNTFTGGTTLAGGTVTFFDISGTAGNPAKSPFGKGTAPTTILSGGFKAHTGYPSVRMPNALVLAGDAVFPAQAGETNLILTGPVLLSNGNRTIQCDVGTNNTNASVTFAGPIRDAGSNYGLLFTGSGNTYLSATNTYGGDTVIQNGKVRMGITNGMPCGLGKGNLILLPGPGTNALFDLNGYDTAVNGISNGGGGSAVIDNQGNATVTLTFGSNDQFSFYSGKITNSAGYNQLVKTGSNRAVFSNASLYLSGGFRLDGGPESAAELTGAGSYIFSALWVSSNSGGNTLVFGGTSQIRLGYLSVGNLFNLDGNVTQSGGDVTVNGRIMAGHWSGGTAQYSMSGGSLNLLGAVNSNPYGGVSSELSGVLYLGIDGSCQFVQTGGVVNAGALVLDNRGNTPSVTDAYVLTGGTLNLASPWGIGGNPSAKFVLGNGILNAPAVWTNGSPLVLAFTGIQTLTGIHTNHFPIVLSNGTMNLLGNLASGTGLTVSNGAVLSGSGNVAGPLNVSGGCVLAPGSNAANLGTLTVGSLSLANTSTYAVDLNGAGPTCDSVTATGSVACGGTLILSNLTNTTAGAVFPILQGSSVTENFNGLGHGTFFTQLGRVFLVEYTATNVTVIDQGPNTSAPQISLLNGIPYAPTNGIFTLSGLATNLTLPNEAPSVFAATNGGAASFITQATAWAFVVDAFQYPEGTNVFVFSALSSNGTTNRTYYSNVIDRTAPAFPQVSVGPTNFDLPFAVSLTATDAYGVSVIYYTMDGTTPTPLSPFLANGGSVTISNTSTVTAFAVDRAGNVGSTNQVVYTRTGSIPGGGTFGSIAPNPRRVGTEPLVITYRRPTLDPVDLVIVDIGGRTVAELPWASAAGNYLLTWTWDGRRAEGSPAGRGMYLVMPRLAGVVRSDLARRIYIQ